MSDLPKRLSDHGFIWEQKARELLLAISEEQAKSFTLREALRELTEKGSRIGEEGIGCVWCDYWPHAEDCKYVRIMKQLGWDVDDNG
jgi:hypothetical protein